MSLNIIKKLKLTDSTSQTCTQIHRYTDTQIHRYTDTQIHRYTDTQIHRYTDTQIHRYIDIKYTDIKYTDIQIQAKPNNCLFKIPLLLYPVNAPLSV